MNNNLVIGLVVGLVGIYLLKKNNIAGTGAGALTGAESGSIGQTAVVGGFGAALFGGINNFLNTITGTTSNPSDFSGSFYRGPQGSSVGASGGSTVGTVGGINDFTNNFFGLDEVLNSFNEPSYPTYV